MYISHYDSKFILHIIILSYLIFRFLLIFDSFNDSLSHEFNLYFKFSDVMNVFIALIFESCDYFNPK